MYFAIAGSDDANQPSDKDELRRAFADAGVDAEIDVYPATQHGWCVADMPPQQGKPTYSEPHAERAWRELLSLYKIALV
jgi:carboxymethylenebutenolidase